MRPRSFCLTLLAATGLMATGVAHAVCNAIPGATGIHRGAVGTLNRPFASPGDFVGVEVNPAVCERLSGDVPGPGIDSDPTQAIVSVLFTPPAGAPHAAIVAADCTQIVAQVQACDLTLRAAGGGAVCKTVGPQEFLVVDEQTKIGVPRRRLFFPFPDTDADFGFPADQRTLSGPAKIVVTPVGTALPCGIAVAPVQRCADVERTFGEIACIDELYSVDGSCDQGPADTDPTFGHFTALPIPNDYAEACESASDPSCSGSNPELRFTTDAAGHAYLPWDYTGILKPPGADGIPIARLGRGLTTLRSTSSGGPLSLPTRGFLTSHAPEGFLLPPLFSPLPNANQGSTTLFGSIDAERGVMRFARQSPTGTSCVGGGLPGSSCEADTDCSGGTCSGGAPQIFDFQGRYADGGVGPVVVASGDYQIDAESSVQLSGIHETGQVLSLVVDENVEQDDLNGDGDMTDFIVTLADPSDGSAQGVGLSGALGLGVARESTLHGVVPVVSAEGDRVAFFVSEVREGIDLNQDSDIADTILMAFQQGSSIELTSGLDVAVSTGPFPIAVVNDNLGLVVPSLFLQNGLAYVGTGEVFGAQGELRRISQTPTGAAPILGALFGQGTRDTRHVAFTSASPDLVAPAPPPGDQVYVVDRDTDSDGILDEPGMTSIALVSRSTSDLPVQAGEFTHTAFLNEGTSSIAAGRFVAFSSNAAGLVPGDTNGVFDIFVRDRDTDADGIFDEPAPASTTVRVSVDSNGVQAVTGQVICGVVNEGSFDPRISPDGRFVTFFSSATNLDLAAADTNGLCIPALNPPLFGWDVFVHDRDADRDGVYDEVGGISTVRVSVQTDGSQGTGLGFAFNSLLTAFQPNTRLRNLLMSDDGRFVPFDSNYNLVPGQGRTDGGCFDVFLRDRDTDGNAIYDEVGGVETILVSVVAGGGNDTTPCSDGVPIALLNSISQDGRRVAIQSTYDNIVTNDTNGDFDVFLYDVPNRNIEPASTNARGEQGAGASTGGWLNQDGSQLIFNSAAPNLIEDGEPTGLVQTYAKLFPSGSVIRAQGGPVGLTNFSDTQVNDGGNIFTSPDAIEAGDTNGLDDVFSGVFDASLPINALRDFDGDGRIFGGYVQVVDLRNNPGSTVEFPAGGDVAVDSNGAMIFMRPESHDGISLNGDADTDDFVAYLHRGRDGTDVLLPTPESTFLAATEVSLVTGTASVAVSEAGQGDTILNSDGDTADSVLYVCDTTAMPLTCQSSGFAVTGPTQAIAPDPSHPRAWAVAFLVPESGQGTSSLNGDTDTNDNVLFLATKDSPPQVVNTGFAADDFVVGEGFVAFRVPEAGQGGVSLNGDGDASDLVLHVLDLTKDPDTNPTAVQSSGSSAVLCELDICDPTVPYRVDGRTVRFLTREPDEQRDLNDDFDQLDLVVQLLNLDAKVGEQIQVVSVVEELSPGAENLGLGLDPLAAPPFDDGNSSQVLLARGVCLADSGLACTDASQCTIGEVCSAGTCQRRGVTCAVDGDCLVGSGEICAPVVAAIGATNSDSDKIPDALDNCPADFNPDQADLDGDGVGDFCDVETCGLNGVEGSEECDDGNTDNGDGCSQFCRVAGCQGDVNLDGRIDQTDMDQFDDTEGCFACAGPGCNNLCDLNGDGNVNNADVFKLRSQLGFFCSGIPLNSNAGSTLTCGVGAELALLVPLLALWRRRRLGGRVLG